MKLKNSSHLRFSLKKDHRGRSNLIACVFVGSAIKFDGRMTRQCERWFKQNYFQKKRTFF